MANFVNISAMPFGKNKDKFINQLKQAEANGTALQHHENHIFDLYIERLYDGSTYVNYSTKWRPNIDDMVDLAKTVGLERLEMVYEEFSSDINGVVVVENGTKTLDENIYMAGYEEIGDGFYLDVDGREWDGLANLMDEIIKNKFDLKMYKKITQ